MATDIPGYDAHDPVPWNTDSGKVPAGPDRAGAPLDWSTDLISDPADPGEASVTEGFSPGINIGSQDS